MIIYHSTQIAMGDLKYAQQWWRRWAGAHTSNIVKRFCSTTCYLCYGRPALINGWNPHPEKITNK